MRHFSYALALLVSTMWVVAYGLLAISRWPGEGSVLGLIAFMVVLLLFLAVIVRRLVIALKNRSLIAPNAIGDVSGLILNAAALFFLLGCVTLLVTSTLSWLRGSGSLSAASAALFFFPAFILMPLTVLFVEFKAWRAHRGKA